MVNMRSGIPCLVDAFIDIIAVVMFVLRFVQYIAMLGGDLRSPGCSVPQTRNDSVVMQYSTDGGTGYNVNSNFCSSKKII